MEDMDKKLLKTYAVLKQKIAAMTEELHELEPLITRRMLEEGVDNYALQYGLFSLVHRKHWEYSRLVKNMEAKLKERKKIEEIKGIARYQVRHGLMFKSK